MSRQLLIACFANTQAVSATAKPAGRSLKLGLAILLIMFLITSSAQALTRCTFCKYSVNSDALTCPKCLRKLQWPVVPERSRSARVIVRTGNDAFIRHPHARIRLYRDDRNSGGDLVGHIGSWGGPTTLRYLLRFDIPQAFANAHVSLKAFKPTRALLKLRIADGGRHNGLPIRIYPLTRPFQAGSGKVTIREKESDGCDWYHSMPLVVWQREGGDYAEKPSAVAILGEEGERETIIDVTALIADRFKDFANTGIWEDPGMIIMRDPGRYGYYGYLTIHSFEAHRPGPTVISPELFIH
jgi:hypothetical protein